jgi:hypothetical protein
VSRRSLHVARAVRWRSADCGWLTVWRGAQSGWQMKTRGTLCVLLALAVAGVQAASEVRHVHALSVGGLGFFAGGARGSHPELSPPRGRDHLRGGISAANADRAANAPPLRVWLSFRSMRGSGVRWPTGSSVTAQGSMKTTSCVPASLHHWVMGVT